MHIKAEKERSKKEFVKNNNKKKQTTYFLVEVNHTLPGSLQILPITLTPLEGGA